MNISTLAQNTRERTLYFALVLCTVVLCTPTAALAFTIHSSFNTLPTGADPVLCEPDEVYGEVSYVLEAIQDAPFTLSLPVVSAGSTLRIRGTATHNGCGFGQVSVSTNGQTETRALDYHESLDFTTDLEVPAEPGIYSYTVIAMSTADAANYTTSSMTLSYRVVHGGTLLVCPDNNTPALAVGATRAYEARHFSPSPTNLSCTTQGYTTVTEDVSWATGNPEVATVRTTTPKGVVTGQAAGNTNVLAQYNGLSAARTVHIVAPVTPIDGTCGSDANSCTSGTWEDTPDTADNYAWLCRGEHSGTDSPVCYSPVPIDGTCGSNANSCTSGTWEDAPDTADSYAWLCRGEHSGTNSPVCYSPMPIDGTCGSTPLTCTAGTVNDAAHADTATEYRWSCDGAAGGSNSPVCDALIPPTGHTTLHVCDASGNLIVIEPGTVTRVLPQGMTDTLYVYDDPTVDCIGTDVSTTAVQETDTPTNSITIALPGTQADVTAHTASVGNETVMVTRDTRSVTINYDVPPPPAPTCLGIFAHASLCAGDSSGLSSDTMSVLTSHCTASTACEYVCNIDYYLHNGVCVSNTPSTGLVPQ